MKLPPASSAQATNPAHVIRAKHTRCILVIDAFRFQQPWHCTPRPFTKARQDHIAAAPPPRPFTHAKKRLCYLK